MGEATDHLIGLAKYVSNGALSLRELDDIVSMGERTSARVFSAALRSLGVDVRLFEPYDQDWFMITDEEFGDANPILSDCEARIKNYVAPLIEGGVVPVVCGFLGKTRGGEVTTLGRGGSDITAFILGVFLKASQVVLVSDVAGVFIADPRIVPDAERLNKISIGMLSGLAGSGARFISRKALKYLNPSLKVRVVSYRSGSLDDDGTVIEGSGDEPLKAGFKLLYPKPTLTINIVSGGEASVEVLQKIVSKVKEDGKPILGVSYTPNLISLCLPEHLCLNDFIKDVYSAIIKEGGGLAMGVRRNMALLLAGGVDLREVLKIVNDLSRSIEISGVFTTSLGLSILVKWEDLDKLQLLTQQGGSEGFN